uniref:G_PROTEIN_RECEP_F1_2 domain-containing protein n=1 Tax=Bursaphelenchus xylophilus TaxID=6326 RepID=A0A1I7SCG4_BURXY
MMSSALCLNMLAVEQHLATIWVETYEERTYRVGLILLLIVCCTAISFLIFPVFRRLIDLLYLLTEGITNRLYINVICVGLSVVNVASCVSSTTCMVMLALEQHLAARFVRTYEERSMSIGVTLTCFTLFYSIAISIGINAFHLHNFDFYRSTDNCHPVNYNWGYAMLFYSASLGMCTFACWWLMKVREFNTRQRRAQFTTLSTRYQQHENENAAISITATVVGYMAYSVIGVVGSLLRMCFYDLFGDHSKGDTVFVGLGYLIAELYALFHMACFMKYNRGMRKMVKLDFLRLFGVRIMKRTSVVVGPALPTITLTDEADEYFRQLQSSWK